MPGIVEVTADTYDDFIRDRAVLMMETDWAIPCRMQRLSLSEIASSNPDLPVGALDVDRQGVSSKTGDVHYVPQTFFYKDGSIVHKTAGLMNSSSIQEKIDKHLG